MMSQTPKAPQVDEPPITVGGREQLFNLLAEASEIEHALMCSYLFAAFSLMHVLSKVADNLVRLPAGPDCPGRTAGLSFTMARAVEPFFTGAAEATLIDERLSDLVAGARRIEGLAPGLAGVAEALERAAASYAGDDFAQAKDSGHGRG